VHLRFYSSLCHYRRGPCQGSSVWGLARHSQARPCQLIGIVGSKKKENIRFLEPCSDNYLQNNLKQQKTNKKQLNAWVAVISRLLVQDILSVNSPYARIRLKGMFVIALRGYLREFGPKTIHFWLLFLSLNTRTDSVLSPSLS